MPTDHFPLDGSSDEPVPPRAVRWLTKGVWGIGLASFLADMGHEVPTALFASLVTNGTPGCPHWRGFWGLAGSALAHGGLDLARSTCSCPQCAAGRYGSLGGVRARLRL